MKPLQPYHRAWLEAHPHRSEEWLKDRLADGFDVHHLDGDHVNNAAGNLILLEHTDHIALHGITGLGRLKPVRGGVRPKNPRTHVGKRGTKAFDDALAALGYVKLLP